MTETMELDLKDRFYIICGATSGFGKAILEMLVQENARILAIGRREEKLKELKESFSDRIETITGDLTDEETLFNLVHATKSRFIYGIVINSAGPPVKTAIETSMEDWDLAYKSLVRWKIQLIKLLLPKFLSQNFARIVFIESSSVKQPVENLILSTSMRLAVIGFSKTLSQELHHSGITVNVMAPGYHDTPALERIFKNMGNKLNITTDEARKRVEQNIPTGKFGNPSEFAVQAALLLSPRSSFITGQVLVIDGGTIKSTL